MTITSDQFDDSLALGGSEFTNALFDIAREVVRRGGIVVVETKYVNAPSEINHVFRTPQDLNGWENLVARVTELAKQQQQQATSGSNV